MPRVATALYESQSLVRAHKLVILGDGRKGVFVLMRIVLGLTDSTMLRGHANFEQDFFYIQSFPCLSNSAKLFHSEHE
jgi:hypothetical protein